MQKHTDTQRVTVTSTVYLRYPKNSTIMSIQNCRNALGFLNHGLNNITHISAYLGLFDKLLNNGTCCIFKWSKWIDTVFMNLHNATLTVGNEKVNSAICETRQ